MTTPSGGSPDDEFWRRPTPEQPEGGIGSDPPTHPAAAAGQPRPADGGRPGSGLPAGGYSGPPPTAPPPPGWRPPVHVQPAPPRQLPSQDMAAMDQAEQQAERLTYGIGAVAGVVLVVLLCLLCSRAIF